MLQAESLINQMLQSPEEGEMMLIPDIKFNPMLVAAFGLSASFSAAGAENFAIGVCRTARQNFHAEIRPTYSAGSYFFDHRKGLLKDDSLEGAKVSLLVRPKHGTLRYSDDGSELAIKNSWYDYLPKAGFIGTDRFVMQVEKSGIKLRIYYVIKALHDEEAVDGNCRVTDWKISQPNLPEVPTSYSVSYSSGLGSLLASANQSLTGFQD